MTLFLNTTSPCRSPRSRRAAAFVLSTCCMLVMGSGCGSVEQRLTINSNPSGALVFLNDQEIGRTPVTRDFEWHGNYDVVLRKDGYEPVKTSQWVVAPARNWIPIDFFVAIFPIHLHESHTYTYSMSPIKQVAVNPDLMMARAEEMRAQLEASRYTVAPTTHPAATPATHPVVRAPATQPAQH